MKRLNSNNDASPETEVRYDEHDEPIVLSKALLDILLKEEDASNLIALYCFYYYTAKWQKTNQPKATNVYCMKCLKIGRDTFSTAQKRLIELGLIERVQKRDKGMIKGWYIRVKFVWNNSKINGFNQMSEKPQVVETTSGKQATYALSDNNIYALSSNKKEMLLLREEEESSASKITESFFHKFWELYPKKVDKGKAYKKWMEICNRTRKDKIPTWKEIQNAIIAQKESERWQDTQFIPLPTTWLNQFRWLDDPKQMISFKKGNKASNKIGSRNLQVDKMKYVRHDKII